MKEILIEYVLPPVIIAGFVLFLLLCLSFLTRIEGRRYAQRKKYLEERVKCFAEFYCPECLYGVIADLQEYVKVCTRMGYLDREINQMLHELVPEPDKLPSTTAENGGDQE